MLLYSAENEFVSIKIKIWFCLQTCFTSLLLSVSACVDVLLHSDSFSSAQFCYFNFSVYLCLSVCLSVSLYFLSLFTEPVQALCVGHHPLKNARGTLHYRKGITELSIVPDRKILNILVNFFIKCWHRKLLAVKLLRAIIS